MIAGREMDALVAEKVMGWRKEDKAMLHGIIQVAFVDTATDYARPIACGCAEDFQPSTDIRDAWQVVEKLDNLGFTTEIDKREAGWAVVFIDYRKNPIGLKEDNAIADTAPLAICLAAFKACGVEMEKS